MNKKTEQEIEEVRQLLGLAKEHIFNILSNPELEQQDFYDLSYNCFSFMYLINNTIKNSTDKNRMYKEIYSTLCLEFLNV